MGALIPAHICLATVCKHKLAAPKQSLQNSGRLSGRAIASGISLGLGESRRRSQSPYSFAFTLHVPALSSARAILFDHAVKQEQDSGSFNLRHGGILDRGAGYRRLRWPVSRACLLLHPGCFNGVICREFLFLLWDLASFIAARGVRQSCMNQSFGCSALRWSKPIAVVR